LGKGEWVKEKRGRGKCQVNGVKGKEERRKGKEKSVMDEGESAEWKRVKGEKGKGEERRRKRKGLGEG